MRTVLIISRLFPPIPDVGGKRAGLLAKYLPEYGWRPVVLTNPLPRKYDQYGDASPVCEIRRDYQPTWVPQSNLRYSSSSEPIPERGATPLAAKVFTSVGVQTLLRPRALALASRLASTVAVDAILASFAPASCLIDGVLFSRRLRAPVCFDMRDPWALNFLQGRKPAPIRAAELALERWLLGRAARVILNTREAELAYRAAFRERPPSLFCSIPTGFDPELAMPTRRQPGGSIVLAHFGHCNAGRSLATVLRAIARIRDRGEWPSVGLRLLNLGRVRESDVRLAGQLGLLDSFAWQAMGDYRDGLHFLATVDLQLLIGYGSEYLHVPAKTYDYLLTGAPILALVNSPDAAHIINRTRTGFVVAPDDESGAAEIIAQAIGARKSGLDLTTPDREMLNEHSARRMAERVAAILDDAVLRGPS